MNPDRITESMRHRWDRRIEYLVGHADDLTDWEIEFVDSLDASRSTGKDLTFRQVQALYRIYNMISGKERTT